MSIRLNRYLSECGFCSRRESDAFILEERVKINGAIAQYHSRVTPSDKVSVDDEPIRIRRAVDFTVKEAPVRRKKIFKKDEDKTNNDKRGAVATRGAKPMQHKSTKDSHHDEKLVVEKPKRTKYKTGCKNHTPKKSFNNN